MRAWLFVSGLASAWLLAEPAVAQQPEPTAAAVQPAAGLEEVIVTAHDWNYRGDYYVNADNLHNPYIPGRTIGNVRAAYTPRNDRWELAVWARNVADKHYPMGGYRLGFADSQIFYFGDPLTYGISATINF